MIKRIVWIILIPLVSAGLFLAGYLTNRIPAKSGSVERVGQSNKSYYLSFDDYYYEIPKQKTVDDRLVLGGQFLYNVKVAIKTNTLDDIFNDGAIGVQGLIPLNGDNQAFERYMTMVIKPSAEKAFTGPTNLSFSDREDDKVRVAELTSSKDGKVIRRQYIVNLPQSVAIVVKDDNEAFRSIGKTIGQASVKFADYEEIKQWVLAESFLLRNRMFEDIYRLAHEDLRGATSVDGLNGIADRSKDIFELEAKVSGVKISQNEMSVSVRFIDSTDPSKNKNATMVFRQSEGKWKLIALVLPNGSVTGLPPETKK